MTNTSSFTVDSVGDDEPVTIPAQCTKITINQTEGDVAYTFRSPLRTSTARNYAAGSACELQGQFYRGQTVGYMSVASGSAVFEMLCED